MKDSDGFLPKGWMMHEPYNLHNGTPALAIYTYLYRTTRKNAWQGTLQTLADIVEIPQVTVRRNLHLLQSRGLVTMTPLAYSHYSIQAQRLTDTTTADGISVRSVDANNTEVDIKYKPLDIKDKVVDIKDKAVDICDKPIKDNINIIINKKQTPSSRSIGDTPAAPAPQESFLDRKSYIAKVLSRSQPEYPYTIVFEYAALVNIPVDVTNDFVTHYASTGWHMNNGGRVENWAAALMNWYKRAKRFAERDAKFTQKGQAPMCNSPLAFRRGAGGEAPMTDANRAIYEQEQLRKKEHRAQLEADKQNAISFDEYLARKRQRALEDN